MGHGDPQRAPARFGSGVTSMPLWLRVVLSLPFLVPAYALLLIVDAVIGGDRLTIGGRLGLLGPILAVAAIVGPLWWRQVWATTSERARHDAVADRERQRIAEAFRADGRPPADRSEAPRRW